MFGKEVEYIDRRLDQGAPSIAAMQWISAKGIKYRMATTKKLPAAFNDQTPSKEEMLQMGWFIQNAMYFWIIENMSRDSIKGQTPCWVWMPKKTEVLQLWSPDGSRSRWVT